MIKNEWDNEPNTSVGWANGLLWKAERNLELKFWCGYVYIPNTNELFHHDSDWFESRIVVHGGVTYCQKNAEEVVIGFDCGHASDIIPIFQDEKSPFHFVNKMSYFDLFPVTYKNLDFVKRECIRMTEQIFALNNLV